MAWSTRQIAELAGTSLRAVRHYHDVGLLEMPARSANGYKRYGVAHLVRVLRIKRLTGLGFSLSQIAAMGDASDHPEEALRALDAELAGTIARLERARVELALILRTSAPTDLPPEFAPAAGTRMSDADRALVVVLSRVLGPQGRAAVADALRDTDGDDDPAHAEFDALPADADERTLQDLAERLLPSVRRTRGSSAHAPARPAALDDGGRVAREAVATAIRDLYNPAQIDVMVRVDVLAAGT